MKKIIRLNESDLIKIVSRVISEQTNNVTVLKNKVKSDKQKVITHFTKLYSNPQTKNKFKNKSNVQKVLSFIPTIKVRLYWTKDKTPNKTANGWVNKNEPTIVKLNMFNLTQGDVVYNTILHETAHLIDFYLQKLGEDTVTTSTAGYYNPSGGQDIYVASETETIARIQRLREMLGIGVVDTKEVFSQKFFQSIKNKKMTFGDMVLTKDKSGQYLIISKPKTEKGLLTDLWGFYSNKLLINNEKQPDISALFANNSVIKNGKIYLDLFKMAKVNINTKAIVNN